MKRSGKILRLALLTEASLLAAAFVHPAHAQAAQTVEPVAATAEAAAPDPTNEILIVARRREEKLQSVPLAVTAIAGADLSRQSVVTLSDLTTKVPSLQIIASGFGSNIPRFVIRAQSQFEPIISQDASVAVYFADVVQARVHGINSAMYDLASVQVLKGPQGTLFGRNSTGGAILIVPQEPKDTFGGYVTVDVGNYDLRSLEGALNLPLGDRVQVRISGRSYSHRGYTRAINSNIDFDDANNYSLRLAVKTELTDRLTDTLFVSNFHALENGSAYKLFAASPTLSAYALGPAILQELSASKNEGFWTNHTELKANMSRLDTLNVANTTRYDLTENVYIKNIFGYRHLNTSVPFDFDGSSQLLQSGLTTLNASQYSDELQLSGSAFDNSLDFIAGLYAFKESGREVQLTTLDYRPAFLRQLNGIGDVKNKSRSVFAQGTWHVPNVEGLSVTAGGRYTWDDRSVTRIAFNGATCQLLSADVGGVPLNPCTRTATYEHKEPTYTAGVDWQVTPNKLIYFTTRKGYRSGGLNQRANLPGQLRPFQPEIVIDYEVGVKADWNLGGAGRLRTNIAAYHQGYSNIQRTQVTNSGVAVLTTVVNAARARVNGLEADVTWTPTHDLSIRAYYALADSKYLEWRVPLAAGGFQDRSDYDFASTPRSSGGATITYTHALPGDDGEISLQGDIYTQSKTQLADDNLTPEGVNAGYTVANARVEWRHPMASDLTLAAWVRNLAAEKYYTGGSQQITAGLGTVVKNLGAPRTFGVSARYDF